MRAVKEGGIGQALWEYGNSDFYGFHMPGHKRRVELFTRPFLMDITEIPDFDDLHHPERGGLLFRAQERAARLYGAEETHFLVNGSTAGILSALSGCITQGGKLLMARNSHRSAYQGAALRNLEVRYLYPPQIANPGINGGIFPEDVEKLLAEDREIQAVFVTSPTYDGVCSDVRAIAKVCHRFGKPLIVDQAHGAHFPFSGDFPEDALKEGADVVIHSVHKTLPSLTQTALLHIQGELADREKIRYYLSVYQSSSPSYLLMASIDGCLGLLEEKGEELFSKHLRLLEEFRQACRDFQVLRLWGEELPSDKAIAAFDRSKLLVSTWEAGVSGQRLSRNLRERYHLQMEMEAPYYLVGISGIADSGEGFSRLEEALHQLDAELAAGRGEESLLGKRSLGEAVKTRAELSMGKALDGEKEAVGLEDCAGRISAAFLYLYPPGIPLLAPGEKISPEARDQILSYREAGLMVQGLMEGRRLAVLKETEK